MRVIVCGSRKLPESAGNVQIAVRLLKSLGATEVVSGDQHGADAVGEMAAARLGITVKPFPAEWRKFGNQAGPIRNRKMAAYSDICLAFPGGKGTASMLREAVKSGLRIVETPAAAEPATHAERHAGHGSEV